MLREATFMAGVYLGFITSALKTEAMYTLETTYSTLCHAENEIW
jgi:hypothetical protein